MRPIECEICDKKVTPTSGKQKTCMSAPCRRELRSRYRQEQYYSERKTPVCVWCLEPIFEYRKRKYHAECREDKNRERVRAYNREKRPRQGPKQKRTYRGTVKCHYCGKRVKKTGARQITCLSRECDNARKRDRKKEARERRRRFEKLRERKLRRKREDPPRRVFRVAV